MNSNERVGSRPACWRTFRLPISFTTVFNSAPTALGHVGTNDNDGRSSRRRSSSLLSRSTGIGRCVPGALRVSEFPSDETLEISLTRSGRLLTISDKGRVEASVRSLGLLLRPILTKWTTASSSLLT